MPENITLQLMRLVILLIPHRLHRPRPPETSALQRGRLGQLREVHTLDFFELDCLAAFQNGICTKKNVPFSCVSLPRRAVKKIRQCNFDLTRDLPMDADLGEAAWGEESEGKGFRWGFRRERWASRFRDVDVLSPMFG